MSRPTDWKALPYYALESLLYRAPIVIPTGNSAMESIEDICCGNYNDSDDTIIQKYYLKMSDEEFENMCVDKLNDINSRRRELAYFVSNL